MSLLYLIVVLVVVGVVMYLINTYVRMDATIKQILNIAVIVFLIIWLLSALGILPFMTDIRLHR